MSEKEKAAAAAKDGRKKVEAHTRRGEQEIDRPAGSTLNACSRQACIEMHICMSQTEEEEEDEAHHHNNQNDHNY